jgi:peptidoglycan/xylan/chitin deacetylase (PgdA/CDA1 family)
MRNLLINLGFFLANLGLLALLLCPAVTAARESSLQEEGLLSMPPGTEPGLAEEWETAPVPAQESGKALVPAEEEGPADQGNEPELPRLEDVTPAPPETIEEVPGGNKEDSVPEATVYRRLPTKDKVVALTFDDGPGKLTKKLLKILEGKKVPATFFLLGNSALNNPKLVKAIADGGCQLALHTWSHPNLTKLKKEKIYWQIEACAAAFAGLEADYLPLLRPPYGRWNAEVQGACQRLNCHMVLWDVDSRDWEGGSAAKVLARVLDNLKPGSIVLFHEGKNVTLEVLPKFIDEARARGYQFVLLGDYIPLP